MKPLDEWPKGDRLMFILDIMCVILCTLVMATTGFELIGILAIVFCAVGGVGIFLRNNPDSIKG